MAEALHVIVDSFGRPLEGEWQAIKSAVTEGMNSMVGSMTQVAEAAQRDEAKMGEIAGYLSTLNQNFKREIGALKAVMIQIAQASKVKSGVAGGGGSGMTGTTFKNVSDGLDGLSKVLGDVAPDLKKIGNVMESIAPAFKAANFNMSDIQTHNLLKELTNAVRDCCKSVGGAAASAASSTAGGGGGGAAGGGGGGGSTGGGGTGGTRRKGAVQVRDLENDLNDKRNEYDRDDYLRHMREQDRWHRKVDWLNTFEKHIGTAQQVLLGFSKEMNLLSGTFKGVVGEEVKFIKDTREAAYEINGITGATHGLQDAMTDIGKTVAATGFNRTDFQVEYLKALKGGIRDQKTALQVTTAQLNTEKQLGLAAGELGDMFVKFSTANNMSNMQIAEMGRGMRDVARFTGLTGKELAKAVGSSQALITVLRNAATLTATTAKNLMEITANSQKLGVEEQVGTLLKAMSSTTHLFNDASQQTKALLFQAASEVGRVGDLMNGTVLRTKAGMKDMAKGMESILQKFGVESAEAIDTLSDSAKMQLNLQVKAAFGLELGEFQQSLKALKESSKTVGDRLDDIRKKQQANVTVEEKLALMEEARRLKTSKSFEMLTALDEAAKGAKDMNSALAQFGTRQKDFEGDLQSMGKSWTSSGQVARDAIEEAIKGVNESLVGSGKKALSIDSSEIEKAMKDPTAFRELTAKLSKAEQESATAQKAALDPMSKIEQGIHELNDTMRDFSSKSLSSYMNITGVLGLLVPALGLLGAQQGISLTKNFMDIQKAMRDKDKYKDPLQTKLDKNAAKNMGKEKKGTEAQILEGKFAKTDHAHEAASTAGAAATDMKAEACCCGGNAAPAAGAAATQAKTEAGGASAPETGGLDDMIKRLQTEGPKAAKLAGMLAIAAVGIIVLGIALVKLCTMLLSAFKLDIGTVIKTVGVIATIAVAAAALGAAVYYASEPLAELGKMDVNQTDMLNGAKKLLLVGPALFLLAVAVLSLIRMIGKFANMDWKAAIGLAMDIAAIIGAAGAIGLAMKEAEGHLKGLVEAEPKIKDMVSNLWKGAIAIARVIPPLLAFAVVIVLFGKAIDTMGLTPTRLVTIAGTFIALAAGIGGFGAALSHAEPDIRWLGESIKKIVGLDLVIWSAVGAIGLVTMPLIALGAILAAFGAVVIDGFGLTPERLFVVAATWVALMSGVSAFAWAIVKSAPKLLALLGLVAALGEEYYTAIWTAVGVVAALSLPLIALGAILAAFGAVVIDGFGLSPARLFQIAATWTILAIAIGVIALALLEASPEVMAMGAIMPMLTALYVAIWAAVGVIGALSAPLIALGAILALFGAVVIDGFGLTPARMYDIAAIWTILAVAIGSIALALVLSIPSLILLELMYPLLMPMYGVIWAAVGVIALLSLPLIALGAILAAFGNVVIDKFGLSAARMEDIGKTFLYLAIAVGGIGYALMFAVPSLAALGAAALGFVSVLGLLWASVVAFRLLTPPLIALAAVIADFGEAVIDDLGLSPSRMDEIGSTFVNLAWSIEKLSLLMMAASVSLAVLGKASISLAWIAPFVFAGIVAFKVLSMPIMALGETIAGFGEILIDDLGLTPSRMKDIGDTFYELANSVMRLTLIMMIAAERLAILAGIGLFSGIITSIMDSGVEAFKKLVKPLESLAEAMSDFGASIDENGLKEAAARCESIAKVLSVLPPMFELLDKGIRPLTEGALWNLFGTSVLDQIQGMQKTFQEAFPSIATFIKDGIIGPIMTHFGADVKKLDEASKVAEAVAKLLVAVPKIIKGLSDGIAPLMERQNWGFSQSKMKNALEVLSSEFKANFVEILKFISNGIIDPIFGVGMPSEIMLNPQDVDMAGKIMKGIAVMLPTIPTIIEALNGPIAKLTKVRNGNSKIGGVLDKIGASFRENFVKVLQFVSQNILDPIFGINVGEDTKSVMLNPNDIEYAAKIMKGLAEMLPAIPTVIEALNGPIAKIINVRSGKSKIGDKLDKIGVSFKDNFVKVLTFVSKNILDPIFGVGMEKDIMLAPEDIAMAGKVMKGLAEMLPSIPIFINTLGTQILAIMNTKTMKVKMTAITEFATWFANVSRLLTEGMILPIQTLFPQPEEVQNAENRLDGMSQVISKLPKFLREVYVHAAAALAMIDNSEIKGNEITRLSRWFYNVATLLTYGVVRPIEQFPAEDQLAIAIVKLDKMGELMSKVPDVAGYMIDGIDGIRAVSDKGSWLYSLSSEMGYFMRGLGSVAQSGIIDPMSSWPKEDDINNAITRLTKLDELFRAMADAMSGVAQAAEAMSKVDIDATIDGFNSPEEGYAGAINRAWENIMGKQSGAINTGAFDQGVLKEAGSSATEQMTKNATALQGTMSELFSPANMKAVFAGSEDTMKTASSQGSFTEMVSKFVDSTNAQMGMGDTNALIDTISKQSSEITALQSTMRMVDTYTSNIMDLFERSSKVIGDIKKTTEYMSMFGDLDVYEKQISEKIASSKEFVPTVQRIAEKIGKGFNFEGGKAMIETITNQESHIEEMKVGLQATESYTKKLASIFEMASNTVLQIKQVTSSLTQLESIKKIEANIQEKIATGNSFVTSVLKTVSAVATSFGTSSEIKTALATVQTKIQQASSTSAAISESLKFVETIRQLQESVLQVGQAAAEATATSTGAAGGAGTANATGGLGGTSTANAIGGNSTTNGTSVLGGGEAIVLQALNQMKDNLVMCAESLSIITAAATTTGLRVVVGYGPGYGSDGNGGNGGAGGRGGAGMGGMGGRGTGGAGMGVGGVGGVGGRGGTGYGVGTGGVGMGVGGVGTGGVGMGVGGIGGMGGTGNNRMLNNAMSSTLNSSTLSNTTLGGGVPGAGMPMSIPGARVSLATPEPTQTAAHTSATASNIQSQIMQDRATSTSSSASGSVQDNSALQGIVKDGNLTQDGILAVLKAMYEMMKPKSSGSSGVAIGDTSTNSKISGPPSYYRSPTGDFNSSSGKGVTNMARMR